MLWGNMFACLLQKDLAAMPTAQNAMTKISYSCTHRVTHVLVNLLAAFILNRQS